MRYGRKKKLIKDGKKVVLTIKTAYNIYNYKYNHIYFIVIKDNQD